MGFVRACRTLEPRSDNHLYHAFACLRNLMFVKAHFKEDNPGGAWMERSVMRARWSTPGLLLTGGSFCERLPGSRFPDPPLGRLGGQQSFARPRERSRTQVRGLTFRPLRSLSPQLPSHLPRGRGTPRGMSLNLRGEDELKILASKAGVGAIGKGGSTWTA